MIHLLSPAKSLDFESDVKVSSYSEPFDLETSAKINQRLQKLSHKKLKDLMSISDDLTTLNVERNKNWKGDTKNKQTRQAIYAFNGDVYTGLDAYSLNESQVEYAQAHLRILSGLYGILKPQDLIEPYRLEMGTNLKVGRKNNLYELWKDKVTEEVNEALNNHHEKVIINLASQEYFKVIEKKKIEGKIVSPEFKDAKNGNYKVISFFAKKARGLMSRFLITNQITNTADLQAFDLDGYRFNADLSTEDKPVFTREENWK